MKAFIGALILVFVVWIVVNNYNDTTLEYVKEETTLEVVEEPKEAWMVDEEAIQAAKDVIRKKELQAELENIDAEMKGMLERRRSVAKELDAY